MSDSETARRKDALALFSRLFILSESRGKEASGLVLASDDRAWIMKSAVPASRMIKHAAYRSVLREAYPSDVRTAVTQPSLMMGHSRLVTTGSHHDNRNNQPVVVPGAVGVHNGIVVNHDALWDRYPEMNRTREVDTEVILALMQRHRAAGRSFADAVQKTYAEIEGTASVAVMFDDVDVLLLATNNGSLYLAADHKHRAAIFASERYILEQLIKKTPLGIDAFGWEIVHVRAGTAVAISLCDLKPYRMSLDADDTSQVLLPACSPPRRFVEVNGIAAPKSSVNVHRQVGLRTMRDAAAEDELKRIDEMFPYDTTWSDSLRRCSRCLLPETMPYIVFDRAGVCSFCHRYQPMKLRGREALDERVKNATASLMRPDTPQCVVGMSGGRDSLYSLHIVREELGLSAVAYTYDWGMVTDLARRNISRICAKLGVEHILVSADITRKRENIRRNVEAWLKRPRLGVIPLFMAGDKQYFYYLQQVRRQTGAPLAILGENMLERTDFKSGYAGVRPHSDPNHVYTLPLSSKVKMMAYYGKEYLLNRAYLNRSLVDTAFATVCYYAIDRDYLNLYTYVPWIEKDVVNTLVDQYGFELAEDTKSTWRIGDGTAAFYNYIYYQVAGFTENDTFRSNQIREGMIDRATALRLVREENHPRWATIQWYLRTIGLEQPMTDVIERIHRIPRR